MIVLDAKFELSAPNVGQAPPGDLPEFCFAGRSNVGKSSMLNVLAKRHQLARVSKTPGRTRLLNFFRIDLADRTGPTRRTAAVRFCDLPGYGYAKASAEERKAWAKMIGEYLVKRESLVATVALVDLEVGPQPKDYALFESLEHSPRAIIVCATKADRLPRTRRRGAMDKLAKDLGVPASAVVPWSSVDESIGRDVLWNAMLAAAGIWNRESDHLLEPAPDETDEETDAQETDDAESAGGPRR